MKRTMVLVLLFGALCAVVLSCGTTGGGGGSSSTQRAAPAPAEAGSLGAFRARMEDNFQYGNTYQAVIANPRLLDGHQIVAGETYTLKVTFTASRDVEDKLQIGFVDTTERANWWTQLSWDDDKGVENAQIPAPKQDEVVSATITLKTIVDSTGSSASANAIVFMTEGEGVKGRAGSGVQKPFNINFTEFVLTLVEE